MADQQTVPSFLRVPVGRDAHRWTTFAADRTLVVAARTLTSTIRALEVLPGLVRGDPRVAVVFAYDSTSAFSDGSLDLLHDSGCRVMPWDQLPHITPDLMVSASENIDVPDGDYPVLVIPHGIGFQKHVPDSRSPRSRLSGVVPDALLETGRARLAVSHPDQERQLLTSHPKSAGHTLLVGDPCLDELQLSSPWRRDYRRALGVDDDRRLVLVSSTWGTSSLIGRHPDLPARLLAGLPWDGYRVALVLHPNVWSAHGAWHIRTLQADAIDAGLLLVSPIHQWRTALLAADAVIGDHGSVTLYGAALGKPVALAAFGDDAVPGTASAELARQASRLDPGRDPEAQIDGLLRAHEPDRYRSVAARAFAEPGSALPRLRAAVYELLRLPPPDAPASSPLALPKPENPAVEVTSWLATTRMAVDSEGRPSVTVSRVPSSVAREPAEDSGTFTHLMASLDGERNRRVLENASVLLGSARPSVPGAVGWVRSALASWPGSLLAAIGTPTGAVLVGARDGQSLLVAADHGPTDPAHAAAAVYTCMVARHDLGTGRVSVCSAGSSTGPSGPRNTTLTIEDAALGGA